ncbi:MAG: DUF480 domain-containing protein [Trueperaceae bacterium]
MPLSDIEIRVLGALVEKERTTPEAYPLSNQALVTACNQKTSREPLTDYHLQDVMEAVQRLRDRGLAATVQEVTDRVPKHRHRLLQALEVDARELALLSVLMLRGPQTPGELRSRTERYLEGGASTFESVGSTEAVLASLATRKVPLVKNLGRNPGQSQDRWNHTLGIDEQRLQPRLRARPQSALEGDEPTEPTTVHGADADRGLRAAVSALEERVANLEVRLDRAERALLHGE